MKKYIFWIIYAVFTIGFAVVCFNAVTYVKPGGTLVYSTCTIAKEETDMQVDWILENLPLQLVSLNGCLGEELLENTEREGVLQLLPGREKTDGFFLAKFRKV